MRKFIVVVVAAAIVALATAVPALAGTLVFEYTINFRGKTYHCTATVSDNDNSGTITHGDELVDVHCTRV